VRASDQLRDQIECLILFTAITKTKADYWLSGPGGVLDLLRFLERKLLGRSPKTISRASSVLSVADG